MWWSSELNLPIPVHFSSLIPKMSMFNLAISCLTMSNFPWFMDLIFQIPMQYCSLQHQTLLLPSNTLTAELHSCFGPATSVFPEVLVIALRSSPVAHWTPSELGGGAHLLVLYLHAFSPGMNTGVGCLSLLQGISPIQGWNWGLLHCRRILDQLSYQGSPMLGLSFAKRDFGSCCLLPLVDRLFSVLLYRYALAASLLYPLRNT